MGLRLGVQADVVPIQYTNGERVNRMFGGWTEGAKPGVSLPSSQTQLGFLTAG